MSMSMSASFPPLSPSIFPLSSPDIASDGPTLLHPVAHVHHERQTLRADCARQSLASHPANIFYQLKKTPVIGTRYERGNTASRTCTETQCTKCAASQHVKRRKMFQSCGSRLRGKGQIHSD